MLYKSNSTDVVSKVSGILSNIPNIVGNIHFIEVSEAINDYHKYIYLDEAEFNTILDYARRSNGLIVVTTKGE